MTPNSIASSTNEKVMSGWRPISLKCCTGFKTLFIEYKTLFDIHPHWSTFIEVFEDRMTIVLESIRRYFTG